MGAYKYLQELYKKKVEEIEKTVNTETESSTITNTKKWENIVNTCKEAGTEILGIQKKKRRNIKTQK